MLLTPAPAGQIVLEELLGVAVLDLDLDPADPAGRGGLALDGELDAGGTTRPSIGVLMVVSTAVGAGTVLRS
jgi:hypothetical protein